MRLGASLQLAAVMAGLVAYSVLSHYSTSHPQARDLGAMLALAPMLIGAVVLIWRWTGAPQAVLAAAAACYLLSFYWPLLTQNFTAIYLLQECGFYAILAAGFATSLQRGRVPLCTRLADKVHGPLSAQELRYTRRVTVAWLVFFLLNIALSVLLFEFASLRHWSLFVNFCSIPLVLLMFAAEYAVRRVVLPRAQRSGLMATLRVYFANPP